MTRDPFRIEGPAVVSFSGGRTSALMLRRILDAHDGRLPDDVHAVFANTGRERPETLDFVRDVADRWRVPVRWVERDAPSGHGKKREAPVADLEWREVDYDTASRNGEPFAELIASKQFLPNAVMRFCTEGLKLDTMRGFMLAQGYEHWTNAVGLRADEPFRVAKVRGRTGGQWDSVCPLADAGVALEHVSAYWRASPFDLRLRPWEGNCDACMLKGVAVLERIERDRPGTLAWWARQERVARGTFAKERNYLRVIQRARQPALPGAFDEPPDVTGALPCACTD